MPELSMHDIGIPIALFAFIHTFWLGHRVRRKETQDKISANWAQIRVVTEGAIALPRVSVGSGVAARQVSLAQAYQAFSKTIGPVALTAAWTPQYATLIRLESLGRELASLPTSTDDTEAYAALTQFWSQVHVLAFGVAAAQHAMGGHPAGMDELHRDDAVRKAADCADEYRHAWGHSAGVALGPSVNEAFRALTARE